MTAPTRWTLGDLDQQAKLAAGLFRAERLAVTDAWDTHYRRSRSKFESLFAALGSLGPGGITQVSLAQAYQAGLGDALRYLAGPPISDDDLQVLAEVESIAAGALAADAVALRKVFAVIERVIDPQRFPWVKANVAPTAAQLEAALLASSVLLAAQGIATDRRKESRKQEANVKQYLVGLGFKETASKRIRNLVEGPQKMEFCGECLLGERKADVVVRLHDMRLLAIECKVSNSSTNSIKRLKNDAAAKAGDWLDDFGATQVVPAAVLAGVYKVLNLEQSQARGLALFWSHDLGQLGAFIASTQAPALRRPAIRAPR